MCGKCSDFDCMKRADQVEKDEIKIELLYNSFKIWQRYFIFLLKN